MLLSPDSKQTPLKDALREAFVNTPEDSVVKFVHMGLKQLRDEANAVRVKRNMEVKEEYKAEWVILS